MHHDSRVYIELRYDDSSCDVVIVAFRDRGILPVEVQTEELQIPAPVLTGDLKEEVQKSLYLLIEGLYEG